MERIVDWDPLLESLGLLRIEAIVPINDVGEGVTGAETGTAMVG